MRLLVAVGLVNAAVVGPSGAAEIERYPVGPATVRITGGGWGHGRGMSQWGAFQAASEGRSYTEILAFYYPGTTLSSGAPAQVRVLLASDLGRDVVVRAVPGLTAWRGSSRPAVLPPQPEGCRATATRWRAVAVGGGLALDAYCGRWVRVLSPGPESLTFEVPGEPIGVQNGGVRRGYRGQIRAEVRGRAAVRVTNVLPMEQYLRSVVASEVSPAWPEQALAAQSVAARSFAAHEVAARVGQAFDVYDGTRSQSYPGAVQYNATWASVRVREAARTDAAVAATAGVQVVLADGSPALTQFSSSNGGGTAATALPYMRASVDDWDARAAANPRRKWVVEVSPATIARRYPRLGQLSAIEVLGRDGVGPWGGRIAALRLVGTSGSVTITGDAAIRAALQVHSSLFAIG